MHPGPEAVPSTCLNHAWAGEGKEMEGMGGGGFGMKMKGEGGGGGGVLNRWVRVVGRFSPFNVHKWVLKLGLKYLEKLMY